MGKVIYIMALLFLMPFAIAELRGVQFEIPSASTDTGITGGDCPSGYVAQNITSPDGVPECVPISSVTETDPYWTANSSLYLKLNQSTPQNITSGTPIFRGWQQSSDIYPSATIGAYVSDNDLSTCMSGVGSCYGIINFDNPYTNGGNKKNCQIDNYDGLLRFICEDGSVYGYFDSTTGNFVNDKPIVSTSGTSYFSGIRTDNFELTATTPNDWFLKTDGTGIGSWSSIQPYETDPLFNAWLDTPPTLSNFIDDIGYMISGTSILSDLLDVSETPANDSQVLTWNGTAWTPTDIPAQNTTFTDINLTGNINMIYNTTLTTTIYNYTTQNFTMLGKVSSARLWNDTFIFSLYNTTDLLSMWGFNNYSVIGDNATFFTDNLMLSNGSCTTCPTYFNNQYYKNSLNFTTDFITIGNSATRLDFTSASKFTIALWIYPRSNGAYTSMITKSASGVPTGYNIGFDNTGKIRFLTNLGTALLTTATIPLNTWQQIVVVYNTNSDVKLYWNGVLNNTSSSMTLGSSSAYNLVFGRLYSNAGSYEYDGILDEVYIWNKALSTSEVSNLYRTNFAKYNNTYFEVNTSIPNISMCATNSSNYQLCIGNSTTTIQTAGTGIIGYNATSGFTFNNLIQLLPITLPTCSTTTKNSIGANNTGTYGCNSTAWVRLF